MSPLHASAIRVRISDHLVISGASENKPEVFCALEILVGSLEGITVCKAGVLHVLAEIVAARSGRVATTSHMRAPAASW